MTEEGATHVFFADLSFEDGLLGVLGPLDFEGLDAELDLTELGRFSWWIPLLTLTESARTKRAESAPDRPLPALELILLVRISEKRLQVRLARISPDPHARLGLIGRGGLNEGAAAIRTVEHDIKVREGEVLLDFDGADDVLVLFGLGGLLELVEEGFRARLDELRGGFRVGGRMKWTRRQQRRM